MPKFARLRKKTGNIQLFIILIVIAAGIITYTTLRPVKTSVNNSTEPTTTNPTVTKSDEKPSVAYPQLSGTYRCWSFNSGAGGDSCRMPPQPPLVLGPDGTYKLSSEEGTYEIKDGKIYLSQSKIRGAGTLLENSRQIKFEYTYNGRDYTVTYLKQD